MFSAVVFLSLLFAELGMIDHLFRMRRARAQYFIDTQHHKLLGWLLQELQIDDVA